MGCGLCQFLFDSPLSAPALAPRGAAALRSICKRHDLQADDRKQTPRERFLSLNPNYAKGSGDFYRRQYLPSAAPAMTSAIDDPNFTEADARRILNTLIDDSLEKYVDGGGTTTRLERFRLVQAMDQAVKGIVKNAAALERYRKWREDTNRQTNALTFLMTVRDFTIPLPKKLADAGWTVAWSIRSPGKSHAHSYRPENPAPAGNPPMKRTRT